MDALRRASAAAFARSDRYAEEIRRLEETLPPEAVRECRLEVGWPASGAFRRLPPSRLELESYAAELARMAGHLRAEARMAVYRAHGIAAFRASA